MCRNLLTFLLKNIKLLNNRTNVRGNRFYERGTVEMTNSEKELIGLICENDNPEQAVLVAIKVFSAFLEQLEADPVLQVVGQQESS